MKRCLGCDATFAGEPWSCPACGREPRRSGPHLVFAPALADGGTGDADYTYEALLEAEGRHFWFDGRSRLITWALRRHLPEARTLFEVGCGTGFVMMCVKAACPQVRLAASDTLVGFLDRAAARLPGVVLYQMDARAIPFRDEFDVIAAFDVIEHIDEDEAVLRELRAALHPGGGVLLTVPQHAWLWSPVDDWSRHRRRYSRRDLVMKLERAGFRVTYVTSFTALMLPALVAARKRPPPKEFDPLAELQIGSTVNAVLRAVNWVERTLIRAGVTFPAGGSLLVVARRVG